MPGHEGRFLYLSRADVASAGLGVSAMIGLLETAFREKGHGRIEMPPKPGVHTRPDAFLHAMPAYIPAMQAAGIKWVGGYPDNHTRGLPYITGLLVLNDVDTGLPYAVMDCTWITAYRTAAASALSARYLARPDSRAAGILACGVQGHTNLEALAAVFPVARVYAYDIGRTCRSASSPCPRTVRRRDNRRRRTQGGRRRERSGGDLRADPEAPGADDSGGLAAPRQLRPARWISTATGAARRSRSSTRSPPTTRAVPLLPSVGTSGRRPIPARISEKWSRGSSRGARRADERTLAINLGLALDDMAVAPEVFRLAVAKGLGTWLPL